MPASETQIRGPITPDEIARIAARYPKRRRWFGWVVGFVAVVLGTIWIIWSGTFHANPAVAGQVKAFEVLSDTEVRVVLTVDRPDPSVRGSCHVIAQAVNYQQVAELDVDVPPSTQRLVDIDVVLRTINRATSASLQSCKAIG